MSTPHNELGRFRSYAYHHILLVCNNTATAEALANTSEITAFQHQVDDKKRYSKRLINGDEKQAYITLIDGTTDARFYITNAQWENVIAMGNVVGQGDTASSTSMSLDGEIEIVEPMGARFLNRLTKVCDELSTDPTGLVFLLKTIFVGHNEDGTTEMISNIKPLLFIVYDITALFDSSGAKYKMQFIGVINGMGKMPHTQKIFGGFSFSVEPNESLETTLQRIGIQANLAIEQYQKQAILDFSKVLYDASKTEGARLAVNEAVDKAQRFFDSNYRLVKYKVLAPDYGKDTKYIAGDNEPARVKIKGDKGTYNFGPDIGVEELFKKIMATSTGVINDGLGKGTTDGKKYTYKIVSGVKSTDDEFVVEYYIKKYELVMVPFQKALAGEQILPEDGQSITFDYIFTGKNVDIKSFDIKMELGMSFFQIAATADSLPSGKTIADGNVQKMTKGTGAQPVASDGKKRRSKTPLFLGSAIKQGSTRNTRNSGDSASFQALLNRQAAIENVEAKLMIYGNPRLLGEMQILPTDLSKPNGTDVNSKGEIEKPKKDITINPRWLNTPTLVKVNVKMPVDSNDINTEYEDFWYTGYYTLFSITQIFSDGVFLQELDLLSMLVADKLDEKVDKKEESKESKKSKKEEDDDFFTEAKKILGIEDKTKPKTKKIKDIDLAIKTADKLRKSWTDTGIHGPQF